MLLLLFIYLNSTLYLFGSFLKKFFFYLCYYQYFFLFASFEKSEQNEIDQWALLLIAASIPSARLFCFLWISYLMLWRSSQGNRFCCPFSFFFFNREKLGKFILFSSILPLQCLFLLLKLILYIFVLFFFFSSWKIRNPGIANANWIWK